jgi:hypothetical protein
MFQRQTKYGTEENVNEMKTVRVKRTDILTFWLFNDALSTVQTQCRMTVVLNDELETMRWDAVTDYSNPLTLNNI